MTAPLHDWTTNTIINIKSSLSHMALFAGLSDEVLTSLAKKLKPIKLAENDTLFNKGDDGDSLYLIERGGVKIFLPQPDGSQQILNQLRAGDALGQMAVIDNEARTASVVAVMPSNLLRLKRDDFLEVINQHAGLLDSLRVISQRLRLGYLDILKELPLFKNLPDDVIAELAVKLEPISLEKDEVLFKKDDPGNSLFIIKSGRVKIVTENTSGEELVLNRAGPGEYIGDMSLIDERPRSAGVVSLEPTTVLKLYRKDFIHVLSEHPEVTMNMYRNISGQLRFATTYIEQVIEWAKRIGEGDYESAMQQIKNEQTDAKRSTQQLSDTARATELLSAFFTMIKGVQEREQKLQRQLQRLTIQIDQAKRKEDFEAITSTDSFSELRASAEKMRKEMRGETTEDTAAQPKNPTGATPNGESNQ